MIPFQPRRYEMEPGYYETDKMSKKPSRRRGVFLILAALLSGMLLLGGWLVTPALAQDPYPGPTTTTTTDPYPGPIATKTDPSTEQTATTTTQPSPGPIATITTSDPYPEPTSTTNQTKTPTKTAKPDFDLAISKTSVPLYFSKGANNRYVISVYRTNNNTVTSGVSIIDQMPAGVTISNVTAEDWNCNVSSGGNYLSCTYKKAISDPAMMSLPPILIDVEVAPTAPNQVTNTAQLIINDNNLANNSSTITTLIDPVDIDVTKTHSPEIVSIDSTINYTIIIKNNSGTDAKKIDLVDTLPPYINLDSIEISPDIPQAQISNGIIIWEKFDLPKNGGNKTFTIKAILDTGADGKTLVNTVEAKTAQSDLNLANNKAETSFIVGGLDIVKSIEGGRNEVYTGEQFTYTLNVKNFSDSAAHNVTIYDAIPEGLDVIGFSSDDGSFTYNETTRLIRYWKNTLASNKDFNIYITARANSTITTTQTITNSARVTWNPTGYTGVAPTLEDISNVIPLLIRPSGAIEVSKDDGVSNIRPGQILTYTVNISNIGSMPIPSGIKIIDTLPSNAILIDYHKDTLPTDRIIQDDVNKQLTATLNQPLDPGEKVSFRVIVKVNSNLPNKTEVVNTIFAEAPDFSTAPIVSSDQFTDTNKIDIDSSSGMGIVLSVTPTQAKVGDNFTFRIDVKNQGDTKVDDVVVTGAMQPVLDYVSSKSATGTTFSANTTDRTYKWTIGTLLKNQTRSMTMVWKVNTSVTTGANYTHTATLTWNTNKSMLSNQVTYRATPSGTLPGTGFSESDPSEGSGLSLTAMLLAGLSGLLGLAALGYGIWSQGKKSLWANWFMLTGLILLCGGALFGVAAWGFQVKPSERPQELAAISHAAQTPQSHASLPAQPTDFVEVWGWPTPTPQSLPDYPIPEPPGRLNQGPNGSEADSSAVTRIVIPAMGLDTVVKYVPFDSSTWLIGGLKQEVAWMGDTSWPGLGSNTGLAGHVDLANGDSGPFWNLADLKAGDAVTVFTERNQYTYLVRESRIVADSDLSVIAPTEKPQLTLITCAGWDNTLRLYLLRLVVFADLADIKPANEAALNP